MGVSSFYGIVENFSVIVIIINIEQQHSMLDGELKFKEKQIKAFCLFWKIHIIKDWITVAINIGIAMNNSDPFNWRGIGDYSSAIYPFKNHYY